MFSFLGINTGQATLTGTSLNSAAVWLAFRIYPTITTAIAKVEFNQLSNTGSPGNLRVTLTADNDGKPNVSAGAPVDIGGGSPTSVTAAPSNGLNVFTLTNAYTPTAYTPIWIVLDLPSYSSGSRSILSFTNTFSGVLYDGRASSSDTGATWTRDITSGRLSAVSVQDGSSNYLSMWGSAVPADTSAAFVWDNADNPDERGCACIIPAGCRVRLHGIFCHYRLSSATDSNFDVCAYTNDTALSANLSIDISAFWPETGSQGHPAGIIFPDGPFNIDGDGSTILRVTQRPTDGVATVTTGRTNYGTSARRSSCKLLADQWYCHRDGGSGSFTDDQTQVVAIAPILEYVTTGASVGSFKQRTAVRM